MTPEPDSEIIAAMTSGSNLSRRTVGRPARLTLDAILDAARQIGVERLEMGVLADRLGVGVATLYGYVRGRDHLIQLVTDRFVRRPRIVDRSLGWREVLREHAATSFAIYRAWPQLLVQMANGAVGTTLEADYLDSLLEILIARGFAPTAALALYYEVNQVVIGAAVCAGYLDGVRALAGGEAVLTRDSFSSRDESALASLSLCAEGRPLPAVIGDYAPALERLLAERTPSAVPHA